MSNQTLFWSFIILPWFTLFFMKKEEIKRYMPVALFASLGGTAFSELALALDFWTIKDSIFPFYHVIALVYGLFPVVVIWIFKLTYNHFLRYMIANAVVDFILTFIIDPWFIRRGIFQFVNINNFQALLIALFIAVILYGYQMWQEDVLITPERSITSHRLQSAVAKPLPAEDDDKSET